MRSLFLFVGLFLLSVANCGNAQSVPELKSPPQPRKIVNRADGSQVVCFGNRCEIRRESEQVPTPAPAETKPVEQVQATAPLRSVLVRSGAECRGLFCRAAKMLSKLRPRKR